LERGRRVSNVNGVSPKSTELAQEQRYFDHAQRQRQRRRSELGDAPSAAANPGAAKRLLSWIKTKRESARSLETPVAFGRIDDETGQTLYVGHELITDEDREILVINWKTPAAAPFYEANHEDPRGLTRKRTFICAGNEITDFEDLLFHRLAAEIAALEAGTRPAVPMLPAVPAPAAPTPAAPEPVGAEPVGAEPMVANPVATEPVGAESMVVAEPVVAAPVVTEPAGAGDEPTEADGPLGPDALLLSELEGARNGEMRDIVATIHAAQYKLITAPLDQVLVIEGGAGTGKTAVALHRVSHLLFNHGDRLTASDVLIVGPHPAFTRYIRTVLPGLGDVDVVQQDIGQLAPTVTRGRPEPAAVHRLKGEARMAGLLARALEARIGKPEPAERMLFDGRFVTVPGSEVTAAIEACRGAGGPYTLRRRLLRARLLDLARERGGPDGRDRLEPVEHLLDRVWPRFSAPAFLRGLLGSVPRLTAAAGGEFTGDELALLHRRGADRLSNEVWSAADLPLLDEVEALLNGVSHRYGHIVVDEAQDLSPMQLRCVARRSATGSLTIAGDLAQSTGAWARDDWDDVTRHLPATLPRTVVALRYGYRVPRQVYEMAAKLLPIAAPGARPARVIRDGPADPGIHRVDRAQVLGRAVAVAMAHADEGRFVGLVCPQACRADLEAALSANEVGWSSADRGELDSAINLVSPQEAKGLEFDAVVVVEPEEIVAGDERGHRMLYVALTRTTRYLDVVCSGEPLPLTVPIRATPWEQPAPAPRPDPTPPPDLAAVDRLAREIAANVTAGVPEPLWDEVLQRAAALLDQRAERGRPTGRHRRG
jgi:DNA helicase IV